jgi:hypothetical protein
LKHFPAAFDCSTRKRMRNVDVYCTISKSHSGKTNEVIVGQWMNSPHFHFVRCAGFSMNSHLINYSFTFLASHQQLWLSSHFYTQVQQSSQPANQIFSSNITGTNPIVTLYTNLQERLNEHRADLQSLAKEFEVRKNVADKSGFKLENHEPIRHQVGKLRVRPRTVQRRN